MTDDATAHFPLADFQLVVDPAATAATLVAHTPTDPIAQHFGWMHLPPELQDVSFPFAFLAGSMLASLPRNAERTTALRKLLEAKDCAVRAARTA